MIAGWCVFQVGKASKFSKVSHVTYYMEVIDTLVITKDPMCGLGSQYIFSLASLSLA